MTDTDKANALDWLNEIVTNPYRWRMFYSDSETKSCAEATLELLKEQEAVEPINSYRTFKCGNCRNIVGYNDGRGRGYQNNFCSKCGKEVKWDD